MERNEFIDLLREIDPSLRASLDRASAFVDEWWRTPIMPWFTDHGPAHGNRVVDALFALIPPYLQPTLDHPNAEEDGRLSVLELFAVYEAALLHDIGMQSLAQRSRGHEGPADWHEIRKQHSKETGRLILERADDIGLPTEPDLRTAVAMIAEAHSTRTFRTMLHELAQLVPPRNAPVFRADLLACLLLLADELDLHGDRARFPPLGQGQLDSVSMAHNLKHHYVGAWSITASSDGQRSVAIRMVFPQSMSSDQKDLVVNWIGMKLRDQMGLTNRTITDRTRGRLALDRTIRFTLETEQRPQRRALPRDAQRVIEAEVQELTLINHHSNRHALIEAVGRRPAVISIVGAASGTDGRDDLVTWLSAQMTAERTVVVSERLMHNQGGSEWDVVREWWAALELVMNFGRTTPSSPVTRSKLTASLVDMVAALPGDVAFVVARFELMDRQSREWLVANSLRLLVEAGATVVLSTSSDDETLLTLQSTFGSGLHVEHVGHPTHAEVVERLGRYMSDRLIADGIAAAIGSYAAVKSIVAEMELRQMRADA